MSLPIHEGLCFFSMFVDCLQNGTVTPVAVQEGDKVALPEFGGTKIELNNEVLRLSNHYCILNRFLDSIIRFVFSLD